MDSKIKSNKSISKIDDFIPDDLPDDLIANNTTTLSSNKKYNSNYYSYADSKTEKIESKDGTIISKDNKLNNTAPKTETKIIYKTLYSDHGYIEVNKADWENEELTLVPFTNKKSHLSGSLNVSLISLI